MRTRMIIAIAVTFLMFPLCVSDASAQGFLALVEKLEKIEKRLDSLETAQRKAQNRISSSQAVSNAVSSDSSIIALESRLDRLHKDLEQLKADLGKTSESEQAEKLSGVLSRLIEELRDTLAQKSSEDTEKAASRLHGEVDELKKTLEERTGLEIAGFFDMVVRDFEDDHGNLFNMGDFELDLTKGFLNRFEVSSALVFSEEGAEMAVGFIDLKIGGGDVPARGRIFTEPGFHLQVGRYDLPFGIDYQVFAAPDRENVTAPLTTELIMDGGLNDQGFRLIKSGTQYNSTFYCVNGFNGDGVAVGGRIGLTPLKNPYRMHKRRAEAKPLEVGFSLISDRDTKYNREVDIWGVDFESQTDLVYLKGEYVRKVNKISGQSDWGYYFAGSESVPGTPFYLFLRYGHCKFESRKISRTTACLGYRLEDVAVFKLEYNFSSGSEFDFNRNKWFAQFAISF